MRRIPFVSFFISSLISAQYYGQSRPFYESDSISTRLIIPTLIMLGFGTFFYSIIAYFEGGGKKEDKSVKHYNADIWVFLLMFEAILAIIIVILYSNDINPYLVVLPARIVGAVISSKYAKKKERNATLWFFLGLLEYHSALIVLALSKGLLPSKKGNSLADNLYNEKVEKLNDLYKEKLITAEEFEKKKVELETEFKDNSIHIKKENIEKQKEEYSAKLKKAFDDGLLTEEEYQKKINLIKQ